MSFNNGLSLTWSASQNLTMRIADFEEERQNLYYFYDEEMVDQALIKVRNATHKNITKNKVVYNKGRFLVHKVHELYNTN